LDIDKNQISTIYKRFREFDALHKIIKKHFPNYNFNNLPPKMVMGSLNKETVESRRIILETYISSLLEKEDVFSSIEIQEFLELTPKRERLYTNSSESLTLEAEVSLSSSSPSLKDPTNFRKISFDSLHPTYTAASSSVSSFTNIENRLSPNSLVNGLHSSGSRILQNLNTSHDNTGSRINKKL